MKRFNQGLIIFGFFAWMSSNNLWSQALEQQRSHANQFAEKQLRLTADELRDGVRYPR